MNETLLPQMSEKFDIVLKHLMLAKAEIGSAVFKDATNPFHKSRYATLGAHLQLTESVLNAHGLILVQIVNGTPEKSILITTLCHPESSQWIKSYLPLPNPKNDCQGLGSSITYMRRYSINSMLGLNAEDDDGESNAMRNTKDVLDKGKEAQCKLEYASIEKDCFAYFGKDKHADLKAFFKEGKSKKGECEWLDIIKAYTKSPDHLKKHLATWLEAQANIAKNS